MFPYERVPLQARVGFGLIAFGILAILITGQAFAKTEHCPDGGSKIETAADELNGVILPDGTVFCVKGSTEASGLLTADGATDLVTYLGNGHDVSYVVIYAPVERETPSPSTEPSQEVTPSPSSPAPTPRPTPAVSGDPQPSELPVLPRVTLPPTDTQ